jgi:hypothetical protein
MEKCKVPDCGRVVHVRKLCNIHYRDYCHDNNCLLKIHYSSYLGVTDRCLIHEINKREREQTKKKQIELYEKLLKK